MRWSRWLPWMNEHREIVAERHEAEQRAAEVERYVIEPLRAMRAHDYLTRAVQYEMLRRIRRGDD